MAMRHYIEEQRHPIERRFKRLASGLTVKVSVPETLEVPLVEASVLADYEAWFFIASVFANAMVGFLVAGVESKSISLLVTSLVFSILFAVAVTMAIAKRRRLRRRTNAITFRS